MKTSSSFRLLSFAAAALLLLAAAPRRVDAAMLLTLTESGGNVVVNGAGTIDTSALSLMNTFNTEAQITPSFGILFSGPTNFVPCWVYSGGGLTGPANFGQGSGVASSGTGDLIGIDAFHLNIWVPQGYASGSPLTDSTTFPGTFADIGFKPGTYTYTWGTGAHADSLTVTSAVPEPSTWALLLCAGSLVALATKGRRLA